MNRISASPDRLEPLAMLRNLRHVRSTVRTYAFLRNAVRQRRCLCTLAGLSLPCTHDDERACSSTMPNRAPVGCAPGPCRPGPALRGALLPRVPLCRRFRHDDGRACPSTQPNSARIGYAPEPVRPGPGLRRALPLRDLPRQGFRARHHGQRFPAGPGRPFPASARRPG